MVPGWGTMQEASLVTYLRNRHVGEEAHQRPLADYADVQRDESYGAIVAHIIRLRNKE